MVTRNKPARKQGEIIVKRNSTSKRFLFIFDEYADFKITIPEIKLILTYIKTHSHLTINPPGSNYGN
jgi:hypothetical protein